MGNHEVLMLQALLSDDPAAFERWLRRGGVATLRSYGLSRREMTRAKALKAVDAAHLAFLQALPVWHLEGEILCVHAGVKPNVPLESQDPQTLMTIRGRFLTRPHGLPYTVVHGHTPTGGLPEVAGHRINVDTGAIHSGVLTAAVFEGGGAPVRFLRVTSS
jgi:serine/threonine protein phosphatase 1